MEHSHPNGRTPQERKCLEFATAGGELRLRQIQNRRLQKQMQANALLRSCGWLEEFQANPVKSLESILSLESEKKTHQVSATINTESFKKNAVHLLTIWIRLPTTLLTTYVA